MENNLGTWPNLNCVNTSYKNHPSATGRSNTAYYSERIWMICGEEGTQQTEYLLGGLAVRHDHEAEALAHPRVVIPANYHRHHRPEPANRRLQSAETIFFLQFKV